MGRLKHVESNKSRWSPGYDRCKNCGTTEWKHFANGLCKPCHLAMESQTRQETKKIVIETKVNQDIGISEIIHMAEKDEIYNAHHKYVYFMVSGRAVKIGISNDPQKRADQLRGGAPYNVSVIGVLGMYPSKKAEEKEKLLHDKFKHIRLNGEWFEFDKENNDRLSLLLRFAGTPEEMVDQIYKGIESSINFTQ